MADNPKSRTDNILFKIKNNKVLSILIVIAITLIAVIGFWEKISPVISKIIPKTQNDSTVIKKEFEAVDFIMEKYNPDTLRVKKSVHALVSRRNVEMHFIISNSWDLDEPLDGPAGFRYKSYYLPKNGECTISAFADIVCIADLIDSNSTILGSVDSQTIGFKKLTGLEESDPDNGLCSLDDYVNDRILEAKREANNFQLLSNVPALKIFIENETENYQVESRRIKYKFRYKGQNYFVMELITYMEDLGLTLQFGAPEKEYNQFEDSFIELTNNVYFSRLTD